MFFERGTFSGTPVNLLLSSQKCQAVPLPQSVKIRFFCSDLISLDPVCPQPRTSARGSPYSPAAPNRGRRPVTSGATEAAPPCSETPLHWYYHYYYYYYYHYYYYYYYADYAYYYYYYYDYYDYYILLLLFLLLLLLSLLFTPRGVKPWRRSVAGPVGRALPGGG